MRTPHTPHIDFYFKTAIIAASLFCTIFTNSFSQTTTGFIFPEVKKLQEYQNSLKLYYNKLWLAERTEFQTINSKDWTNYLPSFGIQFGLPSVSWSPNILLERKRENKILKSKILSIDRNYELRYNEAILELEFMYRKQQFTKQFIESKITNFELYKAIFEEYKKQYKAHELDPLIFRQREIEYNQKQAEIQTEIYNLQLSIFDLERFAKFNLQANKLSYDYNGGCILEN